MAVITLDQFVAAPPATVWRALTEPELVARWWAAGDIGPGVGHEFTLDMPGFGPQPCRVLESTAPERFVYTFTTEWTLAWTLRAEGRGTRLPGAQRVRSGRQAHGSRLRPHEPGLARRGPATPRGHRRRALTSHGSAMIGS
ncbi:hypothetical protein MTP03_34760 [Tsukamurella sp. PLM1]|nr:hypothetical protein MTP03_34760 [Tsukamurella sp. PLM1]